MGGLLLFLPQWSHFRNGISGPQVKSVRVLRAEGVFLSEKTLVGWAGMYHGVQHINRKPVASPRTIYKWWVFHMSYEPCFRVENMLRQTICLLCRFPCVPSEEILGQFITRERPGRLGYTEPPGDNVTQFPNKSITIHSSAGLFI